MVCLTGTNGILDGSIGQASMGATCKVEETLHLTLENIVLHEARDQDDVACGSLKICDVLEAVIDGATHVVHQRRCNARRTLRTVWAKYAGVLGSQSRKMSIIQMKYTSMGRR